MKEEHFSSRSIHVAALLCCFLLQYFLFRAFIQKEVVWSYPAYFDQAGYLTESYFLHENLKTDFWAGLKKYLSGKPYPHPQGLLLQFEAALFFFLAGPSRSAALTLHFLHFICFQAVLFLALKKAARSWRWAWIGLGILLSVKTTFNIPGGMTDFRLDFPAFCLFGVFISLVLWSNVFSSRFYSFLASLAALWLILTRTLFLLYVPVILILYALWMLFFKRPASFIKSVELKNITGILLFLLLFSSPFLWLARKAVYHYYVVGHLSGTEKSIRAMESGAVTLKNRMRYYPNSFLQHHFGKNLAVNLLALAGIVAVSIRMKGMGRHELAIDSCRTDMIPQSGNFKDLFIFLAAAIIVPLTILTADTAKSIVVANTLVAPAVVLCAWAMVFVFEKYAVSARLLHLALISVLSMAAYRQHKGYFGKGPFRDRIQDAQQIVQMYEDLSAYCIQTHRKHPSLSVNKVTDYLYSGVWMATAYEKHGVVLDVSGKVGHSIFPISEQEARDGLLSSDVLIFLDRLDDDAAFIYPFDQSIKGLMPAMRRVVSEKFRLFNRYRLQNGNRMAVYISCKK